MSRHDTSFFDHARKLRRELVRDLIRWPEHAIEAGYMNPENVARLLADRRKWLRTADGKKMLKIAKEYRALLNKPEPQNET